MIRAYKANYIRFEDEKAKRNDTFIVFEILPRQMNNIQLIVCNESNLILATVVESITEITGYHRYLTKSKAIGPFGIGSLSKLPTNSKDGMLEGIAAAAHIDYKPLAINFGRGLLEIDNDYVCLLD